MKHVFPLNKRFRQIIKLSRLCDKHNIPYDMKRFMDGWALSIPNNESELCCVTQHSFSEGGKKNLLEIEFYIGGYESKGNQSAEEILSQLRKVQKYAIPAFSFVLSQMISGVSTRISSISASPVTFITGDVE